MDSEERRDNQPSQPPSEIDADFRALVENLVYPVVIMDRAGKIRFMNPRAERMLAQGLKERVEAHLRSLPQRQPVISQVRFRVEGAGDLILRIRLSDIKWQDQPATQVALMDVTPYVTTAEHLSQEIAELKEREGGLQDWRKKLEAEVRSLVAERDKVYASSSRRLAQETARLQRSRDEAQAQHDQVEAQLKELVTEKERIEQSLRAELAQLRQPEPKAELANEELVQARRTIDELTSARRELEMRAGESAAEFRQLQEAAAQAESRLAAAQEQSRAEAEKASAEWHQAQNEAQQLRGRIAEVERAMAESAERNRRLDEQVNQLAAAHENATRQLQAESVRRAEAEKTAAQLQAQVAEGDKARAESERLQQRIAESHAMLAQRDAQHGQVQAEVKELTGVQAQLKAALDRQRTERKKAFEEAVRLQQEISKSGQARNEIKT
jgi:chromosome segregation ATPase